MPLKSSKSLALLAPPLFIFWPLGAFILSLFDIKRKSSAVIYVLFTMVYGFSFSFQDTSADSHRIAMVFTTFNYSSFQEIFNIFLIGGFTDLYLKMSYMLVKQFSGNPKILFAFFGLIFGIFSYKSLYLLVNERKRKNNIYLFIVALAFYSIYPIQGINGVRFNTAAIIFFVSMINVLVYKKRIWNLGLILTVLIHFSFIAITPIVFLLKFIIPSTIELGKIKHWVFVFFVISFGVTFFIPVNAIPFGSILSFDTFSSSVGNKFEIYSSDHLADVVNDRSQSFFHRVTKIFSNMIKIYILILVLIIRKKFQHILKDLKLLKLYSFTILFLSIGFFLQTIPSGGRFLIIGFMIFMYMFYQICSRSSQELWNKFIIGLLPVFSFQILFLIGYISYISVSSTLWYGNLLWILNEGIGFSKTF